MTIGLVCPACDALTKLGDVTCEACGHQMASVQGETGGNPGAVAQPTVHDSPQGEQMSMRSCPSCGHSVPSADKFCGQCGARMDAATPESPNFEPSKTMLFSETQWDGFAKLILVRGDSAEDSVSYQLGGTEHVAGRHEGAILFPEDTLVSPRHANFIYRDGSLFVRDEGSVNGVFMRIKEPTHLKSGAVFLVGEQLLQVEAVAPDLGPQPDAEGTYFYASPRRASKMKLVQKLRGGEIGLIYRARNETLSIGRESCDVNFPDDPFISGNHAHVTLESAGRFSLTDKGSKNGTFVRIEDETRLSNGDYVFIGQQLLRVEIPQPA